MQKEIYTGSPLQTRITKHKSHTRLREHSSPKLTNTPALRNVEYNRINKKLSTKKKKTRSLGS
jgi:hypothetical protein